MSKTCHYCGADLTHYDADNDTIQPPATQQDETLLREVGFGDIVQIEQKRFGCENEMYDYKVIGQLESNCYVDVPVHTGRPEVLHDEIVPVLYCICCGVSETKVEKFRVEDALLTRLRERGV